MIPSNITHAGIFQVQGQSRVQWLENTTDSAARGTCKALEAVRGWQLVDVVRFVTPQDVERVRDILL
jgi:hypothetical protein